MGPSLLVYRNCTCNPRACHLKCTYFMYLFYCIISICYYFIYLTLLCLQAAFRGVCLEFMHPGMLKRSQNSSFFHRRKKKIAWNVEWNFVAANLKIQDKWALGLTRALESYQKTLLHVIQLTLIALYSSFSITEPSAFHFISLQWHQSWVMKICLAAMSNNKQTNRKSHRLLRLTELS